MHGLLNSAADWVLNFENQSLGELHSLVSPCSRTRRETNVTQFLIATYDSFDEMILFDLPATIDMVLEVTQQPMLYYAGYSQGALIMFGLLSAKPEYNAKVDISSAPVAFSTHIW
ncbi:unnamed protein product [Ixodes hexagonus]